MMFLPNPPAVQMGDNLEVKNPIHIIAAMEEALLNMPHVLPDIFIAPTKSETDSAAHAKW